MTAVTGVRARPAATFALDVGGTWTRSRRLDDGSGARRVRTPSLLNRPGTPVEVLRSDLVGLLADLAPVGAVAAVSFGAALDERSGVVHGSAPLWGDATGPFALGESLRRRRPDVDWHLVNDVTAAVADLAVRHATGTTRRIGYLTVSSGIAYRQLDWTTRSVLVDERGLQGEVGHAVAQVDPADADRLQLRCECGGLGHLAAVSAGPAVARLAAEREGGTGEDPVEALRSGLAESRPWAEQVLGSVVAPIAAFLRLLWTLDPHLDLVALGGGVVEGLGDHYERELRRRLSRPCSYADEPRDAAWLDARLRCCRPGDVDPMAGAAAVVAGVVEVVR